jgi:uncharacterized membrane protein
MKKLLSYFLRGFLVFVPITLTLYIFIWAISGPDILFRKLLRIDIPGVGIGVTILLIFIFGFLASNWAGKKLIKSIDYIFTKLPVVKLLYNSIKDFVEAFAGEKKRFDAPVLVTLVPGSGIRMMGFVTRQSLDNLNFGLSDYVSVFIPLAYTWGGNLVLVPKDSVKPLEIESSKMMAFIVSGGVTGKHPTDVI